jgi:hypothetical protein
VHAQSLLAALVAGHAGDLVIDAVALSIIAILEQLPAQRRALGLSSVQSCLCHQGLCSRCRRLYSKMQMTDGQFTGSHQGSL